MSNFGLNFHLSNLFFDRCIAKEPQPKVMAHNNKNKLRDLLEKSKSLNLFR